MIQARPFGLSRRAVTHHMIISLRPSAMGVLWTPMAEGDGFEPAEHLSVLNGFQDGLCSSHPVLSSTFSYRSVREAN